MCTIRPNMQQRTTLNYFNVLLTILSPFLADDIISVLSNLSIYTKPISYITDVSGKKIRLSSTLEYSKHTRKRHLEQK